MNADFLIRLMTVRSSSDLRSKANIFAILKESEQWGGRVVLFDKSETKWVSDFLKTNHLDNHKIKVIQVPYDEQLVETITNWGAVQSNNIHEWVQILAEDDSFLGLDSNPNFFDQKNAMLLCPIVYLHKNEAIYERQSVFNPELAPQKAVSIFKNGQTVADSGWHAFMRMDAFIAYSRWVSALPVRLWHLSNQGIWSALFFGNIGLLKSFIFLKDHEQWSSSKREKINMRNQYRRIFGKEDLFIWDSRLYWLGCMANFFFLQANYTSEYQNDILIGILRNLVSRPRLGHFLSLSSPRAKCDYLLNWCVSKTILLKLQFLVICRIKVDVRTNCYRIFKQVVNPLPEDFRNLVSFYDSVLTQPPVIQQA